MADAALWRSNRDSGVRTRANPGTNPTARRAARAYRPARERIETFRADITSAAFQQISALVPDQALARWAAQLAPAVAIEAVIAWLDAGQPNPARAAARVRQAVMGVIGAATASHAECSFPPVATIEGPAS